MWKKDCDKCKHINECNFKNEEREMGIKIIHTTDIHTITTNFEKLKALKEELKEDNHILLVDSGDINSKAKDITPYLNELEYDCVVGGNHDAETTIKVFMDRVKNANFEYLGYDFLEQIFDTPIFKPYHIYQLKDKKIGIIGQTLLNSSAWACGKSVRDMPTLQKYIDEIKDNVDYVILLAHDWLEKNMKLVSGIDLVLAGHTHTIEVSYYKDLEGKSIPVAKCGRDLKCVDVITLDDGIKIEQVKF